MPGSGWSIFASWGSTGQSSDGMAAPTPPITATADGRAAAGLHIPLLIRWNPKRDRFQFFDCVAGDDGTTRCDFRDEVGG